MKDLQYLHCIISVTGINVQPNEANTTRPVYIHELSQCLINPVKVSQLLFSEKCINEETLDKIETLEGVENDKLKTLLSAIHTAVSLDHNKLKVLMTVLSKFEETKQLSERIITEYGKSYN